MHHGWIWFHWHHHCSTVLVKPIIAWRRIRSLHSLRKDQAAGEITVSSSSTFSTRYAQSGWPHLHHIKVTSLKRHVVFLQITSVLLSTGAEEAVRGSSRNFFCGRFVFHGCMMLGGTESSTQCASNGFSYFTRIAWHIIGMFTHPEEYSMLIQMLIIHFIR